jgi:hypoxanthine phosphoribosyltransferase
MENLEVLIDAQRIAARVQDIARQIRDDIPDGEIVLIGILKGSFPFVADLARAIPGNVNVDFMHTSTYGDGTSPQGSVMLKRDHDINIEGRDVIIVEDIVDTGLTLRSLRDLLSTRKPRSLRAAAILDKKEARVHDVPVEYTGFVIPNVFVVGYGLDHAERYRNLPYVAVLSVDSDH